MILKSNRYVSTINIKYFGPKQKPVMTEMKELTFTVPPPPPAHFFVANFHF